MKKYFICYNYYSAERDTVLVKSIIREELIDSTNSLLRIEGEIEKENPSQKYVHITACNPI
jgi:hypothetical protein